MKVFHFSSAVEFRRWLEINHATVTELQVGFYKKNSDQGGLTYQEAVDEALCFGWIDGVIRKIDAGSYTRRFTPRKSGSIWSNVNVAHVARLTALGKMHSAGLRAFAARTAGKTGIYSFEQKDRPTALPPTYREKFQANKKAWAFFAAQAPWYQRKIIHHVTSAKMEPTRLRRLTRVIAASAQLAQI